MPKQRTRLGAAELPRSLTEFLETNPSQFSTTLLLDYIEEVENLNRSLQDLNDTLRKKLHSLEQDYEKRIEALELALERASGTRVIRPLTDQELREKKLQQTEQRRSSLISNHGRKHKGWK